MKQVNHKPPLPQKKPSNCLGGLISPRQRKSIEAQELKGNCQLYQKGINSSRRLEIEVTKDFDFVSELITKPKSQPNKLLTPRMGASPKNGFEESNKINGMVAYSSKTSKNGEGSRAGKPWNQVDISANNVQYSNGFRLRNINSSLYDLSDNKKENKFNEIVERSPFSQKEGRGWYRQKILPSVGTSPLRSRSGSGEFIKNEVGGQKELRQYNGKERLILPKIPSAVSKNTSPRQVQLTGPKKSVLVVLDHDLGFIKDHLLTLKTHWNPSFDSIEDMTQKNISAQDNELNNYQAIFVFIKFSPRVKQQSLKILEILMKSERCFVVKCALDVESVDLCLDYDSATITAEKKNQIEHVLFLERETFDCFSVSQEALDILGAFFNNKLK